MLSLSHSIDEQIIPAKTKYSRVRQYNSKKPTKWGFKPVFHLRIFSFVFIQLVPDGAS